jgi:hypothetical protein
VLRCYAVTSPSSLPTHTLHSHTYLIPPTHPTLSPPHCAYKLFLTHYPLHTHIRPLPTHISMSQYRVGKRVGGGGVAQVLKVCVCGDFPLPPPYTHTLSLSISPHTHIRPLPPHTYTSLQSPSHTCTLSHTHPTYIYPPTH